MIIIFIFFQDFSPFWNVRFIFSELIREMPRTVSKEPAHKKVRVEIPYSFSQGVCEITQYSILEKGISLIRWKMSPFSTIMALSQKRQEVLLKAAGQNTKTKSINKTVNNIFAANAAVCEKTKIPPVRNPDSIYKAPILILHTVSARRDKSSLPSFGTVSPPCQQYIHIIGIKTGSYAHYIITAFREIGAFCECLANAIEKSRNN